MATSGYSGVLKLTDLDDFISPGQVRFLYISNYVSSMDSLLFKNSGF